MKYWLVYIDNISSKEWTAIGLIGFKEEQEAKDYFSTLINTDLVWYHLKEVDAEDYRNYFFKVGEK